MYAILVLISCIAAVMSAPATPQNALQQLSQPSPQLVKELSQLSESLRSTSSLAAAHPEVALGPQMANLNLLSGLSDIVKQIVSGLLNRRQPETPAQPAPPTPTGNDIFTQPGNTGVNMPRPRVTQPRRPMPFNPFSFLFSGGSGNPMGGMLSSRMMFDFMEQLAEGFF